MHDLEWVHCGAYCRDSAGGGSEVAGVTLDGHDFGPVTERPFTGV